MRKLGLWALAIAGTVWVVIVSVWALTMARATLVTAQTARAATRGQTLATVAVTLLAVALVGLGCYVVYLTRQVKRAEGLVSRSRRDRRPRRRLPGTVAPPMYQLPYDQGLEIEWLDQETPDVIGQVIRGGRGQDDY